MPLRWQNPKPSLHSISQTGRPDGGFLRGRPVYDIEGSEGVGFSLVTESGTDPVLTGLSCFLLTPGKKKLV